MNIPERFQESWYRWRGFYPARIAGRNFRCDPDHHRFWQKVSQDHWEPDSLKILSRLLTPADIYGDIGAWIGPTVLHAAGRCRQVYCLEPDRVAYMYLLQNLKLNRLENVLPANFALAASNTIATIASPRHKRGDSMGSLLFAGQQAGMEILCLDWQTWFDLIGRPRFKVLKMDIEGGEFALLPTMEDYLRQEKPHLYLSLHPHLLPVADREPAMAALVRPLSCYTVCSTADGRQIDIADLARDEAIRLPGSYLLSVD